MTLDRAQAEHFPSLAQLRPPRLVTTVAWLILLGVLLVLAILFVLVLFWDTHRLLAIGGMTGLFALLGLLAYFKVRGDLATRPPLMAATLAELRKDAQAVKGEPIHEQQ